MLLHCWTSSRSLSTLIVTGWATAGWSMPRSPFETTWRIVSHAIPAATRQKVRWVSAAEVEGEVARSAGDRAARAVVRAVAANRGELPSGDALRALWRLPSLGGRRRTFFLFCFVFVFRFSRKGHGPRVLF
ncbi:unnamed protein product [Prorocentrum cordatum]|uniref:Secreted protein n=1 Tax=Prorocentrum cordatum TaxID=2364126 RepID=A0ABN9Y801_9DINO|nr:unnamed protein product [Polarella glacialis]